MEHIKNDPAHQSWNPEEVDEGLKRFYNISDEIDEAIYRNELEQAVFLANEYLVLADEYNKNWNFGNAIHYSNIVLGIVELRKGNGSMAAEYLMRSGKSPGSPQLDTFGPDLELANVLLSDGFKEQVIIYLRSIKTFWEKSDEAIELMVHKIESGQVVKISNRTLFYDKS